MNQNDREALAAISGQIDVLTRKIEPLTRPRRLPRKPRNFRHFLLPGRAASSHRHSPIWCQGASRVLAMD
jgi:hypothetical protein